jgi:hypothetical protein
MSEELSLQAIMVILLGLIGLFVVARAFIMPKDFFDKEAQRQNIRKRLKKIMEPAQATREPPDAQEENETEKQST